METELFTGEREERTERITVRLTRSERAEIEEAARRYKLEPSRVLRPAALTTIRDAKAKARAERKDGGR